MVERPARYYSAAVRQVFHQTITERQNSMGTYGNWLHSIPAIIRPKREMIDTRPPRHKHPKPAYRKPLRTPLRKTIALLLNLRHSIQLLRRLPQPDAQVMRAIAEARHADSYAVPRALDLDGEFPAARRVADEIADLGRA